MDLLNFNSVENVPGYEARAALTANSASVFKKDVDIVSAILDDGLNYILWGGDNQMIFHVLDLIVKDETLATEVSQYRNLYCPKKTIVIQQKRAPSHC